MTTKRAGWWMAILAIAATTACGATAGGSKGGRCVAPLTTISYDANAAILTVVFASGHAYEYAAVPRKVFEDLSASRRRGSFFARNIRGKFECRRVASPPPVPVPVPAEPMSAMAD